MNLHRYFFRFISSSLGALAVVRACLHHAKETATPIVDVHPLDRLLVSTVPLRGKPCAADRPAGIADCTSADAVLVIVVCPYECVYVCECVCAVRQIVKSVTVLKAATVDRLCCSTNCSSGCSCSSGISSVIAGGKC